MKDLVGCARGRLNPKLFVCRRHKLARPKDNEVKAERAGVGDVGRIRTRLDASRAPLICLASFVLLLPPAFVRAHETF